MENAPLTWAYTHAQNAVTETKRSNPTAASEEHDKAADQFAEAAAATSDKEARRVLHLLENQHRKLSDRLKLSLKPVVTAKEPNEVSAVVEKFQKDAGQSAPPRLPQTGRSTARDLSSSIASNLATARGIPPRVRRTGPTSPLTSNEQGSTNSAEQIRGANRQHEAPVANDEKSRQPSWVPPPSVGRTQAAPELDSTAGDAPFQQFYSTLQGAMSKLTAPLAFASLPLPTTTKSEPRPAAAAASSSRTKPPAVTLSSDPDYSTLVSKAALRAIRESSHPGLPHESFMLVPPSGGTMSYADITAAHAYGHSHNHRHKNGTSSDDFVDALSSQDRPSLLRRGSAVASTANMQKHDGKTLEELALANEFLTSSLKEMDQRLKRWEMSSQAASQAMAQSIRSLHNYQPHSHSHSHSHSQPGSATASPENSRGRPVSLPATNGDSNNTKESGPASSIISRALNQQQQAQVQDSGAQKRIEELEEILKKYDRRLAKREDENAKLRDTLAKYRDKWEGLKAGAKARRESQGAEGRTGSGGKKAGRLDTVPESEGGDGGG